MGLFARQDGRSRRAHRIGHWILGSNQEKNTDQMRKLFHITRRVTTMVRAIYLF